MNKAHAPFLAAEGALGSWQGLDYKSEMHPSGEGVTAPSPQFTIQSGKAQDLNITYNKN
ncbi:MAG: hypothetical protein GDA56_12960 [Hormoscilla sp. GM7CHS1pb]|nr:hypothetical protein [Hormoscilla sp. GM7CHS1pb]